MLLATSPVLKGSNEPKIKKKPASGGTWPDQWAVSCSCWSPAARWPTAQGSYGAPGSGTDSWTASSHCKPKRNKTKKLFSYEAKSSYENLVEILREFWIDFRLNSHEWVLGRTVLVRRPRRPGEGLSSHSTCPPHGCHSRGSPLRSAQGCCCCRCRSLPKRCGLLVLRIPRGCEPPARAATASIWGAQQKKIKKC